MNKADLHVGYDQNGDAKHNYVMNHTTIVPSFEFKTKIKTNGLSNDAGIEDRHCHDATQASSIDHKAKRKLILASILCLFFMIGEIIGGALAQSLSIMTDAAHLLTDFASFMISLMALYLAARPVTKRMSFGWYRAEVLGALVSVLLIWVVTAILVYMAYLRIINNNYEINGTIMLITSTIGVAVNIIMAFTLHDNGHGHTHNPTIPTYDGLPSHVNGVSEVHPTFVNPNQSELSPTSESEHRHQNGHQHLRHHHHQQQQSNYGYAMQSAHSGQNITVRAAFIHVIGDLLQSVGVVIAAMIIYFKPQYKIVDPICTFIFSVLVLVTTLNVIRDAVAVLMEATPKELDFNTVKHSLLSIPGVLKVHNLRMWCLTMNKAVVSVHLAVDSNATYQKILNEASYLLKNRFSIFEVTIQLEEYVSKMEDCIACDDPIY